MKRVDSSARNCIIAPLNFGSLNFVFRVQALNEGHLQNSIEAVIVHKHDDELVLL
jgi:hypothetical protein